jgi:ribonuclease HI
MIENALNIYTDGSSFSGPRRGGIGIRFITVDDLGHEVVNNIEVPGYKGSTNNQMELYACVAALKEARDYYDLRSFNGIEIFTDSQYLADNYLVAMFTWPGNKWRNRDGRPIANADIWRELVKLIKKVSPLRVNIHWVKGHGKDEHNRAVDKLAKKSAKNPLNPPLTLVTVRRKQTDKSVEIGSVEMRGQRLRVRIITSEYLRVQKLVKYKYEVLSKGSKYTGNVDVIFSDKDMRAGHHYEVVVNKEPRNPRITRVLRELER